MSREFVAFQQHANAQIHHWGIVAARQSSLYIRLRALHWQIWGALKFYQLPTLDAREGLILQPTDTARLAITPRQCDFGFTIASRLGIHAKLRTPEQSQAPGNKMAQPSAVAANTYRASRTMVAAASEVMSA